MGLTVILSTYQIIKTGTNMSLKAAETKMRYNWWISFFCISTSNLLYHLFGENIIGAPKMQNVYGAIFFFSVKYCYWNIKLFSIAFCTVIALYLL